jgi:hypothetical protein
VNEAAELLFKKSGKSNSCAILKIRADAPTVFIDSNFKVAVATPRCFSRYVRSLAQTRHQSFVVVFQLEW